MKRNHKYLTLAACLVLLTSVACRQKTTERRLALLSGACWVCEVQDGDYVGTQHLQFLRDGRFRQQDSLCFASEDSGFAFRIRLSVSNEGEWGLAGDSLWVKYDRAQLRVLPDARSFAVQTLDDSIGIDRSVKDSMCATLTRCLEQDFRDRYEAVSGYRLPLGKMTSLTKNTLCLRNGPRTLPLQRAD